MVALDPEIQDIRTELVRAREARANGNEGMARVCARRAVGWTIRLRYAHHFQANDTRSAFMMLEWFRDRSGAPPSLRKAAERLTVRINEGHELLHDQDALVDARLLLSALLPEALG